MYLLRTKASRQQPTPDAAAASRRSRYGTRTSAFRRLALLAAIAALALPFRLARVAGVGAASAPGLQAAAGAASAAGAPFAAEKITGMLPPSVYFQGRTAPLQLRNAAGIALGGDQIVWASLVDSSGYSTSVQERYQFYLVSEGPLRFGSAHLPAGAYGGGYVGENFLLMDLGGHTVAQGPLQTDAALRRPRPLQITADRPDNVRLYLGRHWVALQKETPAGGAR